MALKIFRVIGIFAVILIMDITGSHAKLFLEKSLVSALEQSKGFGLMELKY
jgi:hypothetical protein